MECPTRKKQLEAIIRLQDISDELYRVLPATPLGIDSALNTTFLERWQLDINTFHMPWGEMTIMLHDVQHILGIGIEGSLSAELADGEWKLKLAGLFGEPMSKLRRNGYFTSGSINVSEIMHMCHWPQGLETQSTAYYVAIVGSTLLVDKTRTGMRPHSILTVNADQDEIAWGVVTLAYLYRQLDMASRAGCKTIAGCLTLLQTWIYEHFPTFRPHPHQVDVPNKTRAEMWSTQKPVHVLSRLRDCRSYWTP